MPIVYDGTGGLFTRLGKIFQLKKITNTFRTDLRTEVDDIIAVYADADKRLIAPIIQNREDLDRALAGIDSMINQIASATLYEQVKDGLELTPKTAVDALRLLIEDMVSDNTKTVGGSSVTTTVHVDASTIGTTVSEVSATANSGEILVSTKVPMNYLGSATQQDKQCIRQETIRAICVLDESDGRQAGREVFEFRGKEPRSPNHYEWPLGSGIRTRVSVTSASGNVDRHAKPSSNILSNSGFDNWTTVSTCQFWTADSTRASGSYSTGGDPSSSNPIERQATNFSPDGSFSIEFNGDGNEKHRIYQSLGTQAGTPGRVYPLNTYICSFRVRATSGVISSGVIKASITDGSYNDISTSVVTYDIAAAGSVRDAAWKHVNGVFQTDSASIAKDSRFVIQMTTALPSGKSLLIDELVLFKPTPLYIGGPEVGIVRGEADFRNKDKFTIAMTNNFAGENQKFFDQIFGTCSLGYNLPVDGTNRMNDSLIG